MSFTYKANVVALRRALLKANMGQTELSKQSNVTSSTLQKVVAGRSCTVATCNKIAKALGVPVTHLFTCD